MVYIILQTGESQWNNPAAESNDYGLTSTESYDGTHPEYMELSYDCAVDPQDFEERWKVTPTHSVHDYSMSYFPSEEKLSQFLAWRHFWIIAYGERLPIVRCYAYAQAVDDPHR